METMTDLVKSTHDQLVLRLRRGGTSAKTAQGSGLFREALRIVVTRPDVDGPYLNVDVAMWHQKNVYKTHEDKVQITLSNMTGQQAQFTFFPRTGNCPPLDKVEAKIREALDYKINVEHNSVKRRAEELELSRLADQECPVPDGSHISRKRFEDGTYQVGATFYGVSAAAVRQLLEIEARLDAVTGSVVGDQRPKPQPEAAVETPSSQRGGRRDNQRGTRRPGRSSTEVLPVSEPASQDAPGPAGAAAA